MPCVEPAKGPDGITTGGILLRAAEIIPEEAVIARAVQTGTPTSRRGDAFSEG